MIIWPKYPSWSILTSHLVLDLLTFHMKKPANRWSGIQWTIGKEMENLWCYWPRDYKTWQNMRISQHTNIMSQPCDFKQKWIYKLNSHWKFSKKQFDWKALAERKMNIPNRGQMHQLTVMSSPTLRQYWLCFVRSGLLKKPHPTWGWWTIKWWESLGFH